jgi:cadmium resistance protein CadD (predicted permease)
MFDNISIVSLISTILGAIVSFIITNCDDLIVLIFFFATVANVRGRMAIVVGQYLGFTAILGLASVGFFQHAFLPPGWLKYLGILPIFIGVKALWQTFFSTDDRAEENDDRHLRDDLGKNNSWRRLLELVTTVAAMTVANGSDNIAIYLPLFARLSGYRAILTIVIFYLSVGIWCWLALRLTNYPALSKRIEAGGERLFPYFVIALGVVIILAPN